MSFRYVLCVQEFFKGFPIRHAYYTREGRQIFSRSEPVLDHETYHSEQEAWFAAGCIYQTLSDLGFHVEVTPRILPERD